MSVELTEEDGGKLLNVQVSGTRTSFDRADRLIAHLRSMDVNVALFSDRHSGAFWPRGGSDRQSPKRSIFNSGRRRSAFSTTTPTIATCPSSRGGMRPHANDAVERDIAQ